MGGRFDLKGADGAVYTLELGTNTFCRLEEMTGTPWTESLEELQGGKARMTLLRQFVMASLASEPASLEDVGRIIDDIGGIEVIAAAIAAGPSAPNEVMREVVTRPKRRTRKSA